LAVVFTPVYILTSVHVKSFTKSLPTPVFPGICRWELVGAPIWQLVIQYHHPAVDLAVEVRVVGLGDHLILYHLFWEVMKTWYEPDRTLAYFWEKIGNIRQERRGD
jgi:hypothetical protein